MWVLGLTTGLKLHSELTRMLVFLQQNAVEIKNSRHVLRQPFVPISIPDIIRAQTYLGFHLLSDCAAVRNTHSSAVPPSLTCRSSVPGDCCELPACLYCPANSYAYSGPLQNHASSYIAPYNCPSNTGGWVRLSWMLER